jgi:hypothetical protein
MQQFLLFCGGNFLHKYINLLQLALIVKQNTQAAKRKEEGKRGNSMGFTSYIVLSANILFWAWAAHAGTLEVQKDGTKILASGEKNASTVATLKKGDLLTSSERSGMYWRVKSKDGKSGFVSVLAVRAKPDTSGGINDAIRQVVKEGRGASTNDSGRARSSVMGVRGLDDTSDTGMAAVVKPNMVAVYALEDFELAEGSLERLAEGVSLEVAARVTRDDESK